MNSLEAELERARDLDVDRLADAVESIGFECTRCGACCKGYETEDGREPHTATVFPDEVRDLSARTDGEWRDVARPMPYGLEPAGGPSDSSGDAEADESDLVGETFEWAIGTDACGDCAFYAEEDGVGACTVHESRPLICRTYPFSVALSGTNQPMGEAVDEAGVVRAHECEGLGRDIDRSDAESLARALKRRAVRELEEAIDVRDRYEPVDPGGSVVVHDSEGAKRPDGTRVSGDDD